jgi:hypothetical protein
VIRDMPAEIRFDCNEVYVMNCVAGKTDSILDRLEDLHLDMSVIHLEAA